MDQGPMLIFQASEDILKSGNTLLSLPNLASLHVCVCVSVCVSLYPSVCLSVSLSIPSSSLPPSAVSLSLFYCLSLCSLQIGQ